MSAPRRSFRKTVVAGAAGLAGLATAVAWLEVGATGAEWPAGAWLGWGAVQLVLLGGIGWLGLVVGGGLIALRRDALEERGIPYVSSDRRESVPGPLVGAPRRALRRIVTALGRKPGGLGLLPGDPVEVRTLDEILATLDERGTLDGIPFMPEMVRACGRRLRVLRRVEKIYDWVWHTGLRRLHDTVVLEGRRCDGGGHGGCQAMCLELWKEAWLRRPPPQGAPTPTAVSRPRLQATDLDRLAQRVEGGTPRFVCQLTELTGATAPLAWADPRHYLRDLLWGNVRLRPFLVGVALRVFNWVQWKRGGVKFPLRAPARRKPTPHEVTDLGPGELVRIKSKHEIERTLDSRSRNRGLSFDGELHRFCGGTYRVEARVERIVAEQTGRMATMPNPCIALEGVTSTGEYLAFGPQAEVIFWREIWLERVRSGP
jgi:hypothetical protein